MTTTKANKETIAKTFDTTFSALQTICKDFKQSTAFRSKENALQEQEAQAEEANEYLQQYYGI